MKKSIYFIFLILVILLLLNPSVEAAKKKPKKKKTKSTPKRPVKISEELYCSSCRAIMKEALKALRSKKSEADVLAVMDEICNPKLYMVYEYPPPEMREGCEGFIMNWGEVLEKELMKRGKDDNATISHVCDKVTKACKGFGEKIEVPQFDDHIMFDGQPIKVDKSTGKVDLPKEDM